MSRCVRQAFLLGVDDATGRRFDHRKQWVVDELAALERHFGVDVCAYSVMNNHVHLVLRLDTDARERWSDEEVVARARGLFPAAVRLAADAGVLASRVGEYRDRLTSLSWFMRCLNERIARRANREDGCSGRFWEGRFKCRALLDEGALIACMAYVELNPVHAGLAASLPSAAFTSLQQRLASVGQDVREVPARAAAARCRVDAALGGCRLPALLPFANEGARSDTGAPSERPTIPFEFPAYVELVRFTGGAVRADKRGSLSATPSASLRAIGLAPEHWDEALRAVATLRFAAMGERHLIDTEARRRGSKRVVHAAWARLAYVEGASARIQASEGSLVAAIAA
jgi:REP element-mobilizing transposase RayT